MAWNGDNWSVQQRSRIALIEAAVSDLRQDMEIFLAAISGILTPVTFTVTAGQTVTIGLAVKEGTTAVINWGDGTTSDVTNSGGYQGYTKTYPTGGTYAGTISNVGAITHLRLLSVTEARFDFTRFRSLTYLHLVNTGTAVTGVITNMALTYLHLAGTGTAVSGVIDNIALTYLHMHGTGSAVTGVISDMSLTSLYMYGTGTAVSGVIDNMTLTYLALSGTGSAVTGTLKSTSRLTREFINITGEITLPTDRIYGTWGSNAMRVDMSAHKLTADETNATLIRLAAAPISGGNKTVYIYGDDRTSASDAAMTTLNSAGVSVTITGDVSSVTYTVTAGQTVTIGLAVVAGHTAIIDWGDGTTSTVTNSGSYQNYSRTYATGGTYTGKILNVGAITHLSMASETKAVFDFTQFLALTRLHMHGTGSAVTGVISDMALTSLYMYGTGTAVSGVIDNMTLTYLALSGTGSAVTGTLKSTSRLTREFINITGEITLPTDRIYGTWGSNAMRVDMSAHKLTADETNATLIRLAAAPISGGNRTVYIYGDAQTSASDAAMTTLNSAGVSVTITE